MKPVYPELVRITGVASYWRMAPGRYRAFPRETSWDQARAAENGSGYASLEAIMRLKGEA